MDSSDDDAAPEEPPLEPPGGSGGLRMSLKMESLTSGSQLFKEEDAAIKGGEVTLNFTDEGKEFQLNVLVAPPGTALCAPWHSHLATSRVATDRRGADRRVCQGQDQGGVGATRAWGQRATGGVLSRTGPYIVC